MSNTEQIKEAVSNGLKNHKESLTETVDNQYDDGTGKGAMFPDPIADDSTAAANMATIAGFPTAATAGPVKGKKKKKKTDEEPVEEDINVQSTEDYLSELFDEDELSESFKEKLAVIFETALSDRVAFIENEMAEVFNTNLNEQVETLTEDLTTKLDEFLAYVVEDWTKENEIAIERGIKSDIAESFMTGLKGLFESHYIDMPDDKVTVVEELIDAKSELEAELNEQIQANMDLSAEKNVNIAKTIFMENCGGLTDTEAEKYYALVENVDFETEDQYRNKLGIIKESFFKTRISHETHVAERPSAAQILTENIDNTNINEKIDPLMEAYSNVFTFQNRNKNNG